MTTDKVNVDEFRELCVQHIDRRRATPAFREWAGRAMLRFWEDFADTPDDVVFEINQIEMAFLARKKSAKPIAAKDIYDELQIDISEYDGDGR